MKVVCTQENLKRGLGITSRISNGSTTLPVLNNVLIKTEQGGLKLSTTNLEMGVNTWIRCKVDEQGGISVPSKTFVDLINNLPNDNVTLSVSNQHLLIETSNYQTKIKGLAPEEFPLIPQIEEQNPVEIKSKDLRLAIAQTAFAAAYSETQPEISGILFSFEEDSLKLAATDRYRLAEKALNIKNSVIKSVIIPNKAVQELAKVLGNGDGDKAHIFFSQNQIMFKTEETELTSRLIDGQYPDYKQIVPQSFNTEIDLAADELTTAMKTAGIFTQTGNNVTLEFEEPGKLMISSSSGDLGESNLNIPCTVTGQAGKIIFNHRYILDCLSTIGTKNVTFQIINENSPALLMSKELPGYVYLVMPIKI
ncbi:MAG: DNA polymerase III subunit beta [Candidatus Doudnabacteria bacterium]